MAMHISRMENRTVSPISCPLFFRAMSWLMTNIRMSLSKMVGRPNGDGRILRTLSPCLYSRCRMSGFVASENNGCSIDARSSFGTASAMSSTKRSRLGWRSGKRLMLLSWLKFGRSGTRFACGACGPFGTKVWPFRNQSLALSEPRGGLSLFIPMRYLIRNTTP